MMHAKQVFLFLLMLLSLLSFAQASDKNGIVLHARQTQNQVTAVQLVFKGGFSQATNGKEGLEALLLELLVRGGNASMDTLAFRRTLDSLQASFTWMVQPDFSVLLLECPARNTQAAVSLVQQVLLSPRWDAKLFSKIQEERINWLDHEDPESEEKVKRFSRYHYFKNTPYARHPLGTSASVASISLNDLKSCHKNNFVKSALQIYLASPLTPTEVEEWVSEPLARLPLGMFVQPEIFSLKTPEAPFFQGIKDSSATPILYGFVSVPTLQDGKAGLSAFLIASLLDQKLRQEFRLNRSLDVSVYAAYDFQRKPGVGLLIEGMEFKTYALILNGILRQIQEEGFNAEEIRQQRERLLVVYYTGLQENQELAGHLRNWNYFASTSIEENLPALLREITTDDLKQVWNTHFKNFHWTYIGLPSLLQAEDLKGK